MSDGRRGPLISFWSDARRQINDLSDTQLIYVGQLLVRVDEIIDAGLRSVIMNGEFLERITIPDSNLTSLLRGCGYCGLFLSRGAYGGRGRRGRNYAHFRPCRRSGNVTFRCCGCRRSGSKGCPQFDRVGRERGGGLGFRAGVRMSFDARLLDCLNLLDWLNWLNWSNRLFDRPVECDGMVEYPI